MSKYIVNVSGGLTSFEALRRCIAVHGKENTFPVFADTLIEDADLYRFLDDTENHLGTKIVRLADGRNPWQVMKDRRVITIKNLAPCSLVLKRELIDAYIVAHEMSDYVRVFGYDWNELGRMERMRAALAPVKCWFPLADKPFVDKRRIVESLEHIGIKVPRLYALGFEHNNCGGGCVKAGQAHWAHLWRTLPETYALWESKEQEIRTHLGKDISILSDRRGGNKKKPFTLTAFREELEHGGRYDAADWGGCGCYASAYQTEMDMEPPL